MIDVSLNRKKLEKEPRLTEKGTLLATNSAQLREISAETDPLALRIQLVTERGVWGKSWANFRFLVSDLPSPEKNCVNSH